MSSQAIKDLDFFEVNSLNAEETLAIHRLWNKEYPDVISHIEKADTVKYLDGLMNAHHTFCKNKEGEILAWFATFDRDEIRFFVMIVDREIHGIGVGSYLLSRAKEVERELNGWVVLKNEAYHKNDGSTYASPVEFYRKNGFELLLSETSPDHTLETIKVRWRSNEKF